MSLLFDKWPDRGRIAEFIDAVHELDPDLDCHIYETVQASDAADPFPYRLYPPIVHVDRTDENTEAIIESLGEAHGARFAGT